MAKAPSKAKNKSKVAKKKEEEQKSRIQKQIEEAQEDHRREMFKRRLEIARAGLKAFRNHRYSEATTQFHSYLRILEDWKKVPPGQLKPTHFDKKVDKDELLLISGVYWDMAKLHDRTNSDKRFKELVFYLDRYVVFSKGMPFEALCAETMRKYISTGKARHRRAFSNAYSRMNTSKCFVATVLIDHIPEQNVLELKKFRDQRLSRSAFGRALTRFYYFIGPTVSHWILRAPVRLKQIIAIHFVWIASLIRIIAR